MPSTRFRNGFSSLNKEDVANLAEAYYRKYPRLIDAYLKGCARTAIGESVSNFEIVGVGRQLHQWQNYTRFCEANASIGSLGKMPQIALDVITAAQADSILPLFASIQPMNEEHGIGYFRSVYSAQNSGGYNKGDVISSPLRRDNVGDGTLGSQRKTIVQDMVAGTKEYVFNIGTMIRPYQLRVVADKVGLGDDNGVGAIAGVGLEGTVNYETGEIHLTLTNDPAAGGKISVMYNVDVDAADKIDTIQSRLEMVELIAQATALKCDTGDFTNYAFSKRFGRSAVDEVAQDLTSELVRILNTRAIVNLIESYDGRAVNWSKRPPNGVSYAEHKLTFVDAIAALEKEVHLKSGVNGLNRYVVGAGAAATLRGMPQFEMASDASTTSVGLYGYLDGIPVIRATGIAEDNAMYACAQSTNYFNAPMIYAPYMPLFITGTVQSADNPFRSATAAGEWSAMKVVNPCLIAKLEVSNTDSVNVVS